MTLSVFIFKLAPPKPGAFEAGQYREVLRTDGRRGVHVVCPRCDKQLTLSPDIHMIHDNGLVVPSLVCTHRGCDFHMMIQLEGWKPAAPP